MNYLLLIYANEADLMGLSETALQKVVSEYADFTKSIVQAGNFKAADRLKPVSSASTVRVRNGKTMITDGPFAETREQLGGYYLIEAKNLDEATAIAARIPGAQFGSIEVRPVGDFDLAEEAQQEAFATAVEQWPLHGTPANPRAWLISTGRNKAIDRIRRDILFRTKISGELGALELNTDAAVDAADEEVFGDARLRLIL